MTSQKILTISKLTCIGYMALILVTIALVLSSSSLFYFLTVIFSVVVCYYYFRDEFTKIKNNNYSPVLSLVVANIFTIVFGLVMFVIGHIVFDVNIKYGLNSYQFIYVLTMSGGGGAILISVVGFLLTVYFRMKA